MTRIVIVPAGKDEAGHWHVLEGWPFFGHWFTAAAEQGGGRITPSEFAWMVANGQARLWTVWDDKECVAACAVEIRKWQDGSIVYGVPILLAGTGIETWISPLCAEIEPWIRSQGAQKIVFDSRPGMAKYMPDYRVIAHTYEKDLT